jgi:hypothetical protein
LLSGNAVAALRALLLIRHDYTELLSAASSEGLATVLSRRDDDGRVTHQELAIRVAALLSFYLSDDYDSLREEAGLG